MPFGGIRWAIPCENESHLRLLVNKLLTLDHSEDGKTHQHNFAVAVDGLHLYVSDNALKCLGINL